MKSLVWRIRKALAWGGEDSTRDELAEVEAWHVHNLLKNKSLIGEVKTLSPNLHDGFNDFRHPV